MCVWAPIGFKGAVSLCSPALLTSSLHTKCAQWTGASLIPLIWGASWDLTKHSSDKDARSQTCCGIPTAGGKQAECFRESGKQRNGFFLHYIKTVTWHNPLRDLGNPLPLPNLYHPRLPPSALVNISKCKPDRWPSSLTCIRLWLQTQLLRS